MAHIKSFSKTRKPANTQKHSVIFLVGKMRLLNMGDCHAAVNQPSLDGSATGSAPRNSFGSAPLWCWLNPQAGIKMAAFFPCVSSRQATYLVKRGTLSSCVSL